MYLCISNMAFLGGGFAFAIYIPWIDLAVVGLGLSLRILRETHWNQIIRQIGRLMYQGLPDGTLAAAERTPAQ